MRNGIGPDRISDAVANLIVGKLSLYTTSICSQHAVQVKETRIRNGVFDHDTQMWKPIIVNLPINPNTNAPILLCPKNFLNKLPTISYEGFWDYCYSYENELLRQKFGDDIKSRVNKKIIIDFARSNPKYRDNYLEFAEREGASPYDFSKDTLGLINWYNATKDFFQTQNLIYAVKDKNSFVDLLKYMIEQFANYVENQGGWGLLWNEGGKEKAEDACQRLFIGVLYSYCRANNIDLSGEANIGRGPVDFKASQGFKLKALFELKKASNSKFWNGLDQQLPQYLKSEDTDIGFFVVFVFSEKDIKKVRDIELRVKRASAATGRDLMYKVIDARKPLSASKL